MKPGKFKKTAFYFRSIFGLVLVGLLLYKIPFGRTIQTLQSVSIALVVIAIFIIGAGIFVSAFKLQILAKLKNKKITLWPVAKAYYIGFFFNNFMPTDVGGDVFKINELKKTNLRLKDATFAVIIERFTGGLALIIIALFLAVPGVGIFAKFGIVWLQLPFLISVLMLSIGFVIGYMTWKSFLKSYLKQRKTHALWGKLYTLIEGFYVYRDNLRTLLQALIISLVFHLLGAFSLLVLTASIGNTIPFIYLLLVIPIVSFASLLPVSIGALGIKEGALVFSLIKLGFNAPEALSVALLLRLSIYIHSAIGGVLYFFKNKFA